MDDHTLAERVQAAARALNAAIQAASEAGLRVDLTVTSVSMLGFHDLPMVDAEVLKEVR